MKTKPTYEEFCSAIVNIIEREYVGHYVKTNEHGNHMPDWLDYDIRKNLRRDDVVVYYDWSTGGLSGGNCWDDTEPTYYASNETEPEDNPFAKALELYAEDISYIRFRKISSKVLYEYTHRYYEYYGNRSDIEGRAFIVRELYEGLFGDE